MIEARLAQLRRVSFCVGLPDSIVTALTNIINRALNTNV